MVLVAVLMVVANRGTPFFHCLSGPPKWFHVCLQDACLQDACPPTSAIFFGLVVLAVYTAVLSLVLLGVALVSCYGHLGYFHFLVN